jgi:threonine/homoserine/homoserine lactone efflux protein
MDNASMGSAVFWQGVMLGFVLCAPLGPVGLVCMQHTLAAGRWAGALAVLGAAVVDAVYAGTAALGVATVTVWLDQGRFWVQAVAGAVLAAVGVRLLRTEERPEGRRLEPARGRREAFASTVLLMLSNPLPVLAISLAWSGAQTAKALPPGTAAPCLAAGVFAGSALWAPILAFGVGRLTAWVGERTTRVLVRACGAAVCLCGVGLAGAALLS